MIVLVAFVLSVAALSPVRTYSLAEKGLNSHKRRLVLDNAAIRLGRSDRRAVRWLKKQNQKLGSLHTLYHSFQACSLVPKLAVACKFGAKRTRMLINKLAKITRVGFSALWKLGPMASRAEAARFGLFDLRVRRSIVRPLHSKQCLCGLIRSWNYHFRHRTFLTWSRDSQKVHIRVGKFPRVNYVFD